MRTAFSRISDMTDQQRAALADEFSEHCRIAVAVPVAMGIGCRLPGGVVGPEGYWAFLANGGDAITEVPAYRRDADGFYDPDPLAPGRMPRNGVVSCPMWPDLTLIFFGISPGSDRAPRAERKGSRDAGD